ncbi:MAG: energy-coupling factor transporter ATPase [Oscillospiraceae bacterium]|nr:energy-coupling factor transporter ATPase [Oscillospiraceae bacterium]
MSKKSFIEANRISFSYPSYEGEIPSLVLDGIDVSIEEGEFVAVLGHNGSGKSTLAKHFNAILVPTEGSVSVSGISTAEEARLFEIRQEVGMVFQNPDNQIVATIIEEDVAFALENLGVPPAEIRERVDDALRKVDMYDYRLHAPNQLSGGQKQRIAIAGIVAMRPKCVVLDEPTAMLDPKGRREVMKTVKQLNKELGITVVIITHYMDEAAMCDRVVVVDDGKIIMDSTPEKVFGNVELIKERGLDVPQVTELCHELRKEGIDIPESVLTEEECVAVLENLLKGGAQNG